MRYGFWNGDVTALGNVGDPVELANFGMLIDADEPATPFKLRGMAIDVLIPNAANKNNPMWDILPAEVYSI